MNRGTGIGLMAFAIVMVVVGAILEFAVTVKTSGFNIHTVGIILLWAGIGVFVISAVLLAMGGRRRTSIQEDVRAMPGGGSSRSFEERDELAG